MSDLTNRPHIYKKGKIIKVKPLGINADGKKYVFASSKCSVSGIQGSANNLNELIARCLLGIWKLNSYFGLSKDPSDKPNGSKNDSVFDSARRIFKEGGLLAKNSPKSRTKITKFYRNSFC